METSAPEKPKIDRVKIPAWLGSILFHVVVLMIVLLLFQFQPELKVAPGDSAVGGIVLKQSDEDGTTYGDGNDAGFSEASPVQGDVLPAAPTLEETLTAEFSDLDVKQILPNPAIGPQVAGGHAKSVQVGAELGNRLGQSRFPGAGSGTGGSGGKTLSMFDTEGTGKTFVFVIDRSGSMDERGGRPMRAAKSQIVQNIDRLDDFNQFNIIFYNDTFLFWRGGRKMPFAKEPERESAKRFVEGMIPAGGTRHEEPLREAIRLQPEVIFFLTDGDESELQLNSGQLARIQRANTRSIQINVIQFGLGANRESSFLKRLAAENRGMYKYIDVTGLN